MGGLLGSSFKRALSSFVGQNLLRSALVGSEGKGAGSPTSSGQFVVSGVDEGGSVEGWLGPRVKSYFGEVRDELGLDFFLAAAAAGSLGEFVGVAAEKIPSPVAW